MPRYAQGLSSRSASNGRSIENLWVKMKNSNSISRLSERGIDIDSLPKKKTSKGSAKSYDNHSLSTPNLFEIISPRNEKWIIVQEALTNSLFGKTIINMTEVLHCVRDLAEESVTNVMVEFYETQILRNTLHKMQNRMTTIEDIEDCWVQFYRKSLPNINLIFSSLKTQQELIENISLFEFKRRIAKVEDLKEKIIFKKADKTFSWRDFNNMLLILLPIRRQDSQYTDIDEIFEEITALLISPLIGYRGVYIDSCLVFTSKKAPVIPNMTNSVSKGFMNKNRKSLQGLFSDSKSLLDISGDF